MQAFKFMGFPEGKLAMAQAVVYLATSPKSNKVYKALRQIEVVVKENKSLEVPIHLKNAPTKLMQELEFGKEYKYPHDYEYAFVDQEYLPEKINKLKFYEPSDFGHEATIKKRLKFWNQRKNKKT